MLKSNIPASVQAAILSFGTRKFEPRPPQKHKVLGCMVYYFKLSRDSQAVIRKELEPKQPFLSEKESLLDLYDGIKGELIEGFSTRPLNPPKQPEPFSSAHRGKYLQTSNGKNFAELTRMYKALHQMLPKLPSLLE